jgi:hypothetical protein
MRSMQCNVEFGYQLSIRSGTKENHGNLDRVGHVVSYQVYIFKNNTRTGHETPDIREDIAQCYL